MTEIWNVANIFDAKGVHVWAPNLWARPTSFALIFSFRFKLLIQQTDKGTTWKKRKHWIVAQFFLPFWFPSDRPCKTWHAIILRCFPYFHIYLQHPSTTLNFRQVNFNALLFNLFPLPWHIVRLRALSGAQKYAKLMVHNSSTVWWQLTWSNTKRQPVEKRNEARSTNYVQIIGAAVYAKRLKRAYPHVPLKSIQQFKHRIPAWLSRLPLSQRKIAHNNMRWRWLHYILTFCCMGLHAGLSENCKSFSTIESQWHCELLIIGDWGFQNGVKSYLKCLRSDTTRASQPNSQCLRKAEWIRSSSVVEASSWEYLRWPKHSEPISRQESCTKCQWLPVVEAETSSSWACN